MDRQELVTALAETANRIEADADALASRHAMNDARPFWRWAGELRQLKETLLTHHLVDPDTGAYAMEDFGVDAEADKETRAVYVSLNHHPVDHTTAFGEGVNVHYTVDGTPVGVEILRTVPASTEDGA